MVKEMVILLLISIGSGFCNVQINFDLLDLKSY